MNTALYSVPTLLYLLLLTFTLGAAGLIVRGITADVVPPEFAAETVTLYVPENWVVPVILPDSESMLKPAGSPDALQVMGFVPLALRITLYFLQDLPDLREFVVIVGGAAVDIPALYILSTTIS